MPLSSSGIDYANDLIARRFDTGNPLIHHHALGLKMQTTTCKKIIQPPLHQHHPELQMMGMFMGGPH